MSGVHHCPSSGMTGRVDGVRAALEGEPDGVRHGVERLDRLRVAGAVLGSPCPSIMRKGSSGTSTTAGVDVAE